jgi:cytochrome c-type biogenesis protein CcmH/NrfG
MSIGQDRLTFYGVLAAIVIAIVGYFQIGKLYPVAGHPDAANAAQNSDAALPERPDTPQEDAEAAATRPEEVPE